MPVLYDINPSLNLIIYFAAGTITSAEFFETANIARRDRRLKEDTRVLIDFFSARLELTPSDLKLALRERQKMAEEGLELGQTAVITKSSGMKLLADALQLMSANAYHLGIFHNMHDALRWLELAEKEQEATQFWEDTKNGKSASLVEV